eukprot:jgi/Botrbrau1/1471/Bobra.178_3s0028.1
MCLYVVLCFDRSAQLVPKIAIRHRAPNPETINYLSSVATVIGPIQAPFTSIHKYVIITPKFNSIASIELGRDGFVFHGSIAPDFSENSGFLTDESVESAARQWNSFEEDQHKKTRIPCAIKCCLSYSSGLVCGGITEVSSSASRADSWLIMSRNRGLALGENSIH